VKALELLEASPAALPEYTQQTHLPLPPPPPPSTENQQQRCRQHHQKHHQHHYWQHHWQTHRQHHWRHWWSSVATIILRCALLPHSVNHPGDMPCRHVLLLCWDCCITRF
jgi:hypothetical protein